MRRWPIANFVIIGLAVAVFAHEMSLNELGIYLLIERYALTGFEPRGLFGHMWLHGGWLHIIGNMVFLWVFGNAICAKVGNLVYPALYIGFGLAAAIAHLVFSGTPMIGASGAINGVVGAFLVLYPLNSISCLLLWFPWVRLFSVSSFWMILFWFAFDVLGALTGDGFVAYVAHLGGFVAGFVGTAVAVKLRWIRMESDERSLFDAFRTRGLPGHFVRRQPMAHPPLIEEAHPPPFVRVRCPCGAMLRVPRDLCGKLARCPVCERIVRIPEI